MLTQLETTTQYIYEVAVYVQVLMWQRMVEVLCVITKDCVIHLCLFIFVHTEYCTLTHLI